jgi:hypothetical protein
MGNGIVVEQTFGGMQLNPISKYMDKTHTFYVKRVDFT